MQISEKMEVPIEVILKQKKEKKKINKSIMQNNIGKKAKEKFLRE